MKVIHALPVGILMTAGMGVGCGGEPASPTDSSASSVISEDLQIRKVRFESIVREKDEVSDTGGLHVKKDPDLINAWGLALDPKTGLAWVAANETGTAHIFDEDGTLQREIPLGTDVNPTGVAFNPTRGFEGDDFIFATENGTIIGVERGDAAGTTRAPKAGQDNGGAVYKGIALAFVHGKPRLFATDFHNGKIDVYDEDYNLVDTTGRFVDTTLPTGFAPFNLLPFGGDDLIISYAKREPGGDDDVPGAGNGFVDVFDTNGMFEERLLSGDQHPELSSPWGLALSAASELDDPWSLDLLVGNFGDSTVDNVDVSGHINVYDLHRIGRHVCARFEGPLGVRQGKEFQPLAIPGLWSIVFGNGRRGFDRDDIYFAAGPGGETHGLFGELDFVSRRR